MNDHAAFERRFVNDPAEWPKWPLLPLKRRNGVAFSEEYCGFIAAVKAPPYTVYISSIFMLKPGKLSDAVKGVPTEQYNTIEQLLEVWKVD